MKTLKIIAFILAKKNSVRLPNKHILQLGKKKDIEYTFESIKQSKFNIVDLSLYYFNCWWIRHFLFS